MKYDKQQMEILVDEFFQLWLECKKRVKRIEEVMEKVEIKD